MSEIEYYYCLNSPAKELSEIIYEIFKSMKRKMLDLADYKLNSGEFHFSDSNFDGAVKKSSKYFQNLSKLISNYLEIEDGKILSHFIQDELTINWVFDGNLILKGKIDLVCWKDDIFHLIEIKTGKIYDNDTFQIQLYGEIIKRCYPETKIKLWLWYPKLLDIQTPVKELENISIIDEINRHKEISQEYIIKKKKIPYEKTFHLCNRIYCNLCEKEEIDRLNREIIGASLSSLLRK